MLFRYLAARWRYRSGCARHYIRAGLGLERRAQNLSAYWTPHFSRSRAAQARWAHTCCGGLLTVLGAGPLFDLNVTPLANRFRTFRLVDADPLSASRWGRLNVPVEPVIAEITQCSDQWRTAVTQFSGAWHETMKQIEELGRTPVAAYAPQTDGLLSLNILSQLEVGWQESIEAVLHQRFGRRFVQAHEQDWLNAIRPASQTLAEQHLAALAASKASDVLLIADVEYLDYTGRRYIRTHWEDPPVHWTASGWQADPGISVEMTPALSGVTLNQELLARWLPAYELMWHETWLWHIAPLGAENQDHGTIHRVAAFALTNMQPRQ